jgi:hypothetical protein
VLQFLVLDHQTHVEVYAVDLLWYLNRGKGVLIAGLKQVVGDGIIGGRADKSAVESAITDSRILLARI